MIGAIIQVLVIGFAIGALARWAVPGPDPMTVPLTILLGVFGSFIGGGIAGALFGVDQDSGSVFAVLIGSILTSTLLLVAYRRFVQKRPLTGPEAQKPPPQKAHAGTILGSSAKRAQERDVTDQIRRLGELRDQGTLSDEEFESKKAELLARL